MTKFSLTFKCNIFGCSRWVKFYPPVWPSELYFIWNIWQVCLICNNQNNNAYTQTSLKQTLFFKVTSIHFFIPACKQKEHIFNNKSSIYFLHRLTKRPVERKLLSSQERWWNGSILLNRRYYKWFTCLAQSLMPVTLQKKTANSWAIET